MGLFPISITIHSKLCSCGKKYSLALVCLIEIEKTLQHSCLKLCLKYLWCFRVDVAIFSSYCSTQLPVHPSVLISASLTSWHWLKPTAGRPEQSPSGARMLRRLMTTARLMLGCGERTYHAPCAHRPVTAESCHVKRRTHMHAQRTNMQVHTVIPLFIRTHTHTHTRPHKVIYDRH